MSQLFSVMSKLGLDLIKGTPRERMARMAAISIAFTSLTNTPHFPLGSAHRVRLALLPAPGMGPT